MEPLQNGTLFHEYLTITGIKDETGQYSHFAGIFTDITSAKSPKNACIFWPTTTRSPACPTARYSWSACCWPPSALQREGRKIGLMFIDLDRFGTSTTPWATPQATSC